MAQPVENGDESLPDAGSLRRRRVWATRFLGVLFLLFVALLIGLWANRTELAKRFIDEELAAYDIPITYRVETVAPDRQVLVDIVIGDPARPDLVAERLEIDMAYRLSGVAIGQLRLVKPRLWGTLGSDGLSFGSLDPLLFDEEDGDGSLPDINVALDDARVRLDTPYGPVGIKGYGQGVLANGFLGRVAVNAPRLVAGDCLAQRATLYGKLTISDSRPRISGPMRLAEGGCEDDGMRVTDLSLPVVLTADRGFAGLAASFEGRLGSARFGDGNLGTTNLSGRAEYRGARLVGNFDLDGRGAGWGDTRARRAVFGGTVRSGEGLASWDVDVEGTALGLDPPADLPAQIATLGESARNTLLAPLAARLASGLRAQLPNSQLSMQARYRSDGDGASVSIPRATLENRDGAILASLSRGSAILGRGTPRLAGNISTGGAGLPRLTGRMERDAAGALVFRLRMAEYGVGRDRLAIPDMTLRQSPRGDIAFDGTVNAGGRLPGGEVRGLVLPVRGWWTSTSGLALWTGCTQARFDRLAYANLELGRQSLTFCPASGKPVLQAGAGAGARGFRVAAGVPSLSLAGRLGGTSLRVDSGPVGFAYPGTMTAKALDVRLGPDASGIRFGIPSLTARLGEDLGGRFEDADVRLAAVPLDVFGTTGDWSYRGGILALDDVAFRLEDREASDRFEPLVASGASLTLADSLIEASAALRTPSTDALVTDVAIRHDLTTGTGRADLDVPGVTFGPALQPTELTRLALGVVANVRGTVTGTGRIDWNAQGVTSRGEFSSDGLDLAAAFGPVEGARGTIVFDDLLGLTTAPDQRLSVRSVNPGIEVFDGTVQFALRNGELLAVQGGSWPFLGGTLEMRPVNIAIGASETRTYIFEITGLEASQLLERLELANLSANGTFDGEMRIVFDEIGNGRIENGLLVSRPPGGNVSYVGELTYEDLTPIANFAFDALRSLDFKRMEVGIDGPLTGEILTKVRFDGVSQGAGAKRNFITRRLAGLPLRFNVNIRAPFYQLLTNIRSIYDPAYVRDPREIGLLADDGTRLRPAIEGEDVPPEPPEDLLLPSDAVRPYDPPVQTPDSENLP